MSPRPSLVAAVLAFAFVVPLAEADTPEQIFQQVSRSVVVVDVLDAANKPLRLGSGVVIGISEVITNCHVVQPANRIRVRHTDKTFPATLRYADLDRDLCQLNVPGLRGSSVTLGTTNTLKVGMRVYAIGAPKGLELTMSEGLISSLREIEGSRYIQTSAPISSGSSGGGLFDSNARLIGITSFAFVEGQNLNFALPADWIRDLPKRAQSQAVTIVNKDITALDWFNRATALEARKDWQGMLEVTQRWTTAYPTSADAWYAMGEAYGNLDQHENAKNIFEKVVIIRSNYPGAWLNLGLANIHVKQFEQAIQSLQEALRIKLDDAAAWAGLGIAYNGIQQYDKAIQASERAIGIRSDYAYAWYALGTSYAMQQQGDKVKEVHQVLRKLNPKLAQTFFNSYATFFSD